MGLGPDLASERYQGTFLTRRAQRVQLGHDGAGTHRPQGQQGTSSQIGQGEGCPGLCLGDDIVPITVAHQVPEDLRTYTELGIIQEVVAQPQEIRMLGGRECGERPRDGAPLAHIIGEETSAVAIDGRWRHVEGAGSERPLSELQRQAWAILPHVSPCLGRQADHLSSLRTPYTIPHPLPDVLSTRTSFYNYPAGVRMSVWQQATLVLARTRSGTCVPHPDQFRTVLPAAAARRASVPLGHQIVAPAVAQRPLSEYDRLCGVVDLGTPERRAEWAAVAG